MKNTFITRHRRCFEPRMFGAAVGMALMLCGGVQTCVAQVSNSPVAVDASAPWPLVQFNLRFVMIERDPGAPRGKFRDPLTNVVMIPPLPESYLREFLKTNGLRTGAEVLVSSNFTATNRSGLLVIVTNNQILFATAQRAGDAAPAGGPGLSPAGKTNDGSLHAVFDFYPKVGTNRKALQVESITMNSDFVGSKTSVNWNPLPGSFYSLRYLGEQSLEGLVGKSTVIGVQVYDGQALAMGCFPVRINVKAGHQVPLLGDIPGLGRMFRWNRTITGTANLAAFLTVILVNPDGTPLRTPAERKALWPPPPTNGYPRGMGATVGSNLRKSLEEPATGYKDQRYWFRQKA